VRANAAITIPGYEQRLARSVRVRAADAARFALELFERSRPATLGEAIALVCSEGRPSGEVFDAIADAWDRYRYLRDMPWD
jgi:hypothetical protein